MSPSVTPPQQPGSNTPFAPEWIQKVGKLFTDLIIAQVALAFGNITVLGVKPFDFLTQWGHDLQQKASDAYTGQQTANAKADGAATILGLSSGTDLLGPLNLTTIWSSLVSGKIVPTGLLAQLVGGVLPDSQRPDMLQTMIDDALNVISTGTRGSSTNNAPSTFFDSLTHIFDTGTNAQSVNVIQDAQLAAVAVGGGAVSNTETFDGAAGPLDTTKWEQTYGYGSGSGTDGYNGSGKCIWIGSGTANYGCLNRHKTATNTDTQLVQITITSNLGGSTTGNPPSIRLQGRMNSTRTSYIEARMQDGGSGTGVAEIGIVVSGVYTRLGATASFSSPYSGTWTLKIGTTASTREFILLHDTATILSRTDTGATSVINAANRFTAFSHIAGSSLFFSPFQVAPPDVESFGSSDRLAAA